MRAAKRLIISGLAGLSIGTPLDALHVKTGVLIYKYPTLGLQAWWVPVLFAISGIVLCESHHQLRRISGVQASKASIDVVLISLLVLVVVYASSGFLKDVSYIACLIYLAVFVAAARYLWRGPMKLLAILAISAAIIGPAAESLISLTGQFHYLHPQLWKVPVWLPFIYINVVFIAANFDNFLEDR